MRVLGVDPGAVSGAYALLGEHPKETHVGDVPVVDRQVNAAEWSRIVRYCSPDVVVIERVGAMPKQGVSSTFRFGMGAGLIRGVVAGASLPIVDAVPAVWKRHFKLDGEGAIAFARRGCGPRPRLCRTWRRTQGEPGIGSYWISAGLEMPYRD